MDDYGELFPFAVEEKKPERTTFPPRMGVDVHGRGITNPIHAILQLIDGRGLSSAQLDRNAAMFSPLYRSALEEHPEILDNKIKDMMKPGYAPPQPPKYNENDRRMLAEDFSSVKIKWDNWLKTNYWGEELTPQERIVQSFVDVRNPNSMF